VERASRKLRIREQYIKAMDAGAFSALPEPPYGAAFVREYAELVKIDPAAAIEAYERTQSQTDFNSSALPHPIEGAPPSSRMRMIVLVLIVLLGLALIGLVGRESPAPKPIPRPPFISAPLAPVGPSAPGPLVAQPGRVTVDVAVSGTSWLRAIVDGSIVFEGTLADGQRRTFAGTIVALVIGNAGAVHLTVDGHDLGPAGAAGAVYRVTYEAEKPISTPGSSNGP
jgi:hypothetical protein